ncbi:MAG: replicative DNA helicase [Patescibacteria group bacterium]|nr:replicative DNA helicase [Patescibacteria group bacterium]
MAKNPLVPPYDIEAEQATLGSLLIDREAMVKIVDLLRVEDFYEGTHREIYNAALSLYEKRKPIDLLTLVSELKSCKKLDDIGGETYLAELAESTPTAAHIFEYAQIVKQKSTLRRLINAGQEISAMGQEEDRDISEVLEKAEQRLFQVSGQFISNKFIHIKNILSEAYERISELHAAENKDALRGIPTGWKKLDNLLSGLQPSDLVVLAARPSVGKTAIALNIAQNVAITNNKSVGLFSLEMSKEQLVDRMFASLLQVNSHDLRTGQLAESDFDRMGEVIDRLSRSNIFIDDTADCTVLDIRAKSRRLQMEHGLDLIIVDYLQLIRGNNPMNRVQEISEITRSLKAIGRELRVPVLALSQLSRNSENRPTKIPQLSDLRDSGSIEQDADVVLMLYREEMYDEETDRKGIVDIFIRKHRNGPTGHVELYFDRPKQRFIEIEAQREFENAATE